MLRDWPKEGLSPYTRGNLIAESIDIAAERSIPVHTGKPGLPEQMVSPGRVYPRTHGETYEEGMFHPQ